MTRRISTLWLGLFFVVMAAVAGRYPQTKPAPQAPDPMTVDSVAKDLYLVKGGAGANAAFFVTPKQGVVVIDAKMTPEAAAEMLSEIAKVTSQPVRTLILTHSDGDHVNGLPGFPKGLVIFAHKNVKRDLEKAAAEMPALKDYLPTQTYASGADLIGWDYDIDMRHFGPAHTDGDTCVLFPDLGVAFVGDLAFVGRDPLVQLAEGRDGLRVRQDARIPPRRKARHQDLSLRPCRSPNQGRHRIPEDIPRRQAGQGQGDGRGGQEHRRCPEGLRHRDASRRPGGRRRWLSFVETAYLELTAKK